MSSPGATTLLTLALLHDLTHGGSVHSSFTCRKARIGEAHDWRLVDQIMGRVVHHHTVGCMLHLMCIVSTTPAAMSGLAMEGGSRISSL